MSIQKCYGDGDLEKFRCLIEKKLTKAEKILNETQKIFSTTNSHAAQEGLKGLDNSTVVEEQENLNLLVIRLKKLIQHLNAALIRIKNKTFGICRKTGKLISKERLLLVPHATLSLESKACRTEMEKHEGSQPLLAEAVKV